MEEKRIHVGVIGGGCRGYGLTQGVLCLVDDIVIDYVCDVYEDRADRLASLVEDKCGYRPKALTDHHPILEDPAVQVVFNYSSWETHVPIAIESMRAGKPCAFEVGGAYSLQQCWDLVHTYEETGVPCMMLENCCYDKYETMIMNMIRKGLFGDVVHCEGGYRHDLRSEVAFGKENRHYRLENYKHRNSHNYPTHDFGPIAKILGINRGNRMLTLCSMSSKAAGLKAFIREKKADDAELTSIDFAQGDVVTTMIKCAGGETVTLHLDTTLPRFYCRDFTVQGTKAMYAEQGHVLFMDGKDNHNHSINSHLNSAAAYEEEYLSPTWKSYRHNTIGGHGGMDWLVHKAFLDCIRNGEKEMPVDVYDAAAWMSIVALSEESIALGSVPVAVPDFTGGTWISRPPYDVEDFSK